MKRFFAILLIVCLFWPSFSQAEDLEQRLSGRILLQVEANGEAWYVNPLDQIRYFLGRPNDAFELMRSQGIGITNDNLSKIKPGLDHLSGSDGDEDGLPDDLEKAIGTDENKADTDGDGHNDKEELRTGHDPRTDKSLQFDEDFSEKQAGKIFLQVEANGEAWYVSPTDGLRYFLGRPTDAFNIMRSLGLGVTNEDLAQIRGLYEAPEEGLDDGGSGEFDLSAMEKTLHQLINNERDAYGLEKLSWNDDLADVARMHSEDLAEENQEITNMDLICDYPMVHHEGLRSGFYAVDRLRNSEVYNYSKNGENIALVAGGIFMFLSGSGNANVLKAEECRDRLSDWESDLKQELELEDSQSVKTSIILSEIQRRKDQLAKETLKTESVNWKYSEEVTKEMVDGWMNSPGHRANILDMDFDEAGIGVAYVNGYLIGTQVFIKKVECGYFNGPCCDKGGCYKPLACSEDDLCQ